VLSSGPAAFGLSVLTDAALPGTWQARRITEPSIRITIADTAAIEHCWSGFAAIGWEGTIDGAPFAVERGIAGDHRFVHGSPPTASGEPSLETRAVHRLSADASTLQCAPIDRTDPSWWRVVLDSVLFTVALLRGYEALHAGAIATPTGAVAITAGTGGGKSTLVAELIRRGTSLMADDILVLESREGRSPLAYPAPPVMTIPTARTSALIESHCAEVISASASESWLAVPVCAEPLPLTALVVLDRRPGSGSESPTLLTRVRKPLAPVLASLIDFPDIRDRHLARFELASSLASTAATWRLTADVKTPPHVLADRLLEFAL
jgi:hypothetical protein